MRRIKIPFVSNECPVPVIAVTLTNGETVLAIVDSGAQSTIVDRGFVMKNKDVFTIHRPEVDVNYETLSSSKVVPMITADATFLWGDVAVPMDVTMEVFELGRIIDSLKDTHQIEPFFILGNDVMKEYKAKIDYEKKELTIAV